MSVSLQSVVRKKKKVAAGKPGTGHDPAYLVDVVGKLRKLGEYKSKTDEELRQRAKQLTDVDELQADFSHLTSGAFEQFADEIADESGISPVHSMELERAQSRAMRRLDVPAVRLYLFELRTPVSRFFSKFSKLFAFKYGPLHAAIQVGDMMLQWGTDSLVIPDKYDPADQLFQTDVKERTCVAQVAAEVRPQAMQAIQDSNSQKQIDLQFDLTVGVEDMLNKIKKVVVQYNRYRYYNVVMCNCQTFVNDVMKAIGVKNIPQNLTGKLKEYFEKLTKEKSKFIPVDISTHEELDEFVKSIELSTTSQHDKEYLLCLYFQFHLEAMKTDKDPYGDCQVKGCFMPAIELNLQDMLLKTC